MTDPYIIPREIHENILNALSFNVKESEEVAYGLFWAETNPPSKIRGTPSCWQTNQWTQKKQTWMETMPPLSS